ncbi:MAG: sensor histidine kinase [Chloroflexota bacterium]
MLNRDTNRATSLPIVSPRQLNLGSTGDILLAALVVIDLVFAFTLPTGTLNLGDYALLAAASLAYILVGIYGWRRWEIQRTTVAALAYFSIQLILGAFIVYWGYGSAWLLLLPLASQGIELPRRGTLLVGLLLAGIIALPGLFPARLLASGLGQPEGLLASTLLKTLEFAMAVVFVLLFSELVVRERQARAALNEAHQTLREYAVHAEDLATMQERNRLAREIHDSLGHHLTAIHVHLEAARAQLSGQPPAVSGALEQSILLTREGLAEVRRSVAALRASPLEGRSLQEALNTTLADSNQAGLSAVLTVSGEARSLTLPVRQALLRAVQEGLTNASKHAQASRVEVGLEYGESTVSVTIQDNGAGAAHTQGGFGLLGLRERAQLLGGQVEVRTAPGQGFTLRLEVPA